MASFHFVRNIPGSSSAPARNVSTMAPVPARKPTHPDFAPNTSVPMTAPMMSCATVPTTISESAVEILNQIDSMVATKASTSHSAAENQTCSISVSDAQIYAVQGFGLEAPTAMPAIGVIGRLEAAVKRTPPPNQRIQQTPQRRNWHGDV